ncbi:MAG TPA: hypothetical protein VIL30_02350, partial [Ramlibacter sp.]
LYADQIVALRDGRVAGCGRPSDILTDRLIAEVFNCPMRVGMVPAAHIPFVLPQSAQSAARPISKVA